MTDIHIRQAQLADSQFLMSLKNDRRVQEKTLCHPAKYELHDIEKWIKRYADSDDLSLLVVAMNVSDQLVGYINLHRLSEKNRTAYFGIVIDPVFQGQGFGKRAVGNLIDFVKDRFGLRKLLLEVEESHHVARIIYRDYDFKEVGIMRNHFLLGDKALNVVLMEKELV